LSAVRDCLFNMLAATLHIGGRSSIRNLRTRHAVRQVVLWFALHKNIYFQLKLLLYYYLLSVGTHLCIYCNLNTFETILNRN